MKIILIILFFFSQMAFSQERVDELIDTGWNYYYFGMFEEAEKEFASAVKEDPKNQKGRMGYVRSLLKNKKNDEAMQVLQGSEEADEKQFLTALAHFQKSDFNSAGEQFRSLSEAAGKYSTTAAQYLLAIDRRKSRWTITAGSGFIYDSRIIEENVLVVDDLGGGRAYAGGQADYRLLGGNESHLSISGEVQTLYSFDDDLSISDPLRVALKLPYLVKSEGIGDSQIYLAPGYEHIRVDLAGSGSKEGFSNAFLLNYISTRKTSESSARTWRISLRWDQGLADSLTGVSNIDGGSIAFKYDKYWFFNSTQSHGLNFGLLFAGNFADGDNIKYGRTGSNLSYFFPFFWKFKAAALIDGRYSNYFVHLQGRADIEVSAGLRLSRPINDWLGIDIGVFNTTSISNLDERDYSRLVGSVVANGRWRY